MTVMNRSDEPPPARGSSAASVSARLRSAMPVVKKYAYFDHAAVAPLPVETAAAMIGYATDARDQGDVPWLTWSQSIERLRHGFSDFIHATPEEIALIPNTTTGIGLVCEGFRWRPGDSVVVPSNEFPSNLAPWRQLARRGVEVREVPVPASGQIDLDQILGFVDSTTRIVAISWVGFVSGWRIDPAIFSQAIHARGALMFLDAIQGLGAFPLDVREAGIDFCAADGHKWMLGPEGAGMLYVRRDLLDCLDPLMVGWHSLDERAAFDPATTTLKQTAARYEGGSANIVGLMGLERSIHLLSELGSHEPQSGFAEAILANVAYMESSLKQIGCTAHIPVGVENRSGIVTISWSEMRGERDPIAARKHLLQAGIVTSVRAGRLRASTHAYNNSDDIDRLVTTLAEFLN